MEDRQVNGVSKRSINGEERQVTEGECLLLTKRQEQTTLGWVQFTVVEALRKGQGDNFNQIGRKPWSIIILQLTQNEHNVYQHGYGQKRRFKVKVSPMSGVKRSGNTQHDKDRVQDRGGSTSTDKQPISKQMFQGYMSSTFCVDLRTLPDSKVTDLFSPFNPNQNYI